MPSSGSDSAPADGGRQATNCRHLPFASIATTLLSGFAPPSLEVPLAAALQTRASLTVEAVCRRGSVRGERTGMVAWDERHRSRPPAHRQGTLHRGPPADAKPAPRAPNRFMVGNSSVPLVRPPASLASSPRAMLLLS